MLLKNALLLLVLWSGHLLLLLLLLPSPSLTANGPAMTIH
jgi:hypothetical protein